ncbi:MAG: carboxylesterase family protein [Dehalococcoidales bacterium]|nr:carboxylesterase family protein [Dehalococcoidales bacterium]
MNKHNTVNTTSGKVLGYENNGISIFRGIPYAAPPVRFSPPQPVTPWPGVLNATKNSPVVPQIMGLPEYHSVNWPQSEKDSLTLNIWTPGLDDKKRPVMFWVHGGALKTGSNSDYDGQLLSARGDVVVVNINYRLGPLGFLFVPGKTANVGLLDQVEALKWVNRNIASFGGDPSNITVFGESAGALSISCLMTMPAAKGLFKRAILESNVCSPVCSKGEYGEAVGKRLFATLGIPYGDMEALRSVDIQKLLLAYQQVTLSRLVYDTYPPFIDGDVLPTHPYEAIQKGAARDIEMLAGTNENEGALFSLVIPDANSIDEEKLKKLIRYYRSNTGESDELVDKIYNVYANEIGPAPFNTLRYAWEQFGTDYYFRIPVQQYLDAQSKHQPKVYAYLFAGKNPDLDEKLGAIHGLEIAFVFGSFRDSEGTVTLKLFPGKTEEAVRLSSKMMDAWASFARSGNPNHRDIPKWPEYDADKRPTIIFDNEVAVKTNLYAKRNALWKEFLQ